MADFKKKEERKKRLLSFIGFLLIVNIWRINNFLRNHRVQKIHSAKACRVS